MAKSIFNFTLLFIAMLLVQVVCSNICLFNVAMPIVFIYFVLRLPISLNVNWVLTFSFLIGLTVDVFANTLGMNALACTLLAFIRKPVFRLYFPREEELADTVPSIRNLGFGIYFKYTSTLTIIYCALLFLIQSFTLANFPLTLMRIGASSLLTLIILLGLDSITAKSEKGL